MWPNLRRALTLVPRRRRWQWVLILPMALAAALLESLGAGVVLTLGTLLAEPDRIVSLPLVTWVVDRLPSSGSGAPITTAVSAAVALFYLVRALLLTMFRWAQESVVRRTASDVAARLLRAYLRAPYVFHLRRNSAKLIQTASLSVDLGLGAGLGAAVNIATESLTLAALMGVLTYVAPLATLSAAVIGVVLLVPFRIIRRVAARLGDETKVLHEQLLQDLQQSLSSVKEVSVMGVAGHFEAAFTTHRRSLASRKAGQAALSTGLRVFVETTLLIAMLVAVPVATAAGAGGGTLIGLMALYAYVGFRVVPSANRLILNFAVFQTARPHLEGLCGDLALLEQPRMQKTGNGLGGLSFNDCVEFESVRFTYEEACTPALDEVSLTIRRGESVGIIGATGAGKSTLVDVLLGLLEPQSGRVLVDGLDIRSHVQSWQAHIGYVPQTFALLDDTLRRNVAFGRPDALIDDARVDAALALAHLTEMVARLPEKLDTTIGERGVRLSGGERQRLVIARAVYHDPDVLVFDEATSALDHHTEQAIVRAIDDLRGVKTLVVVAHRLTTVRGCDRIVLLQEGRIAAEGRYDDIMDRHAAFLAMTASAN